MSEQNVSLVASDKQHSSDPDAASEAKRSSCCCFRVFACLKKSKRGDCETYELKKSDKTLLVGEDEYLDGSHPNRNDNESTGRQSEVIPLSPVERSDEKLVIDSRDERSRIAESLPCNTTSVVETSTDHLKANTNTNISTVDCHSSEPVNKRAEKPQGNSFNSHDNNYKNDVDSSGLSRDELSVISDNTCENELGDEITNSGLILDVGVINNEQSSRSESTVGNADSQVNSGEGCCEAQEGNVEQHLGLAEGLDSDNCSDKVEQRLAEGYSDNCSDKVEQHLGLDSDSCSDIVVEEKVDVSYVFTLTSGPEECFESSDIEAEDEVSNSAREDIEERESVETAQNTCNLDNDPLEGNSSQNNNVADSRDENVFNSSLDNTHQTDREKPVSEEIDQCCDTVDSNTCFEEVSDDKPDTVNVDSNTCIGDVTDNKPLIEDEEADVNSEKSDVAFNSSPTTQSEPDTQITLDQEINESLNDGIPIPTDLRISPEGSEGEENASLVEDATEEAKVGEEKQQDMNYYSLVTDPLLYTQGDLDEVIKAREDEWTQRQDELERKVKEEIAMRELLEEDHRSKMETLKKQNADMKMVVAQYEKTIMDLTEQSRNTPAIDEDMLSETVRAKDQATQDLNQAEANLVDAYKRIEKLKLATDTYKQNEENLKSTVKDYQIKLQKSEERYNKLKQHASEKIDSANIEIERVRKQKEIDLAGIQASLKKATNRVSNLEVEIAQKTNENKELSQICDELIKKVSGD